MILKPNAEELARIAQEIGAEDREETDKLIRDVEEWLKNHQDD